MGSPAKLLLRLAPALVGQFGRNITFVFSRDFRHETPCLFRADIPGDQALRTRRDLRRRILLGFGQFAKRRLAVSDPWLDASVLLRQIPGFLLESGVSYAVDSFPVTFDLILSR